MENKFLNKKVSFICHLVMAILVLPLLIFYKKEESLVYINSHNNPVLDIVMYHITRLPEITTIIFVVFLGVFTQRRYFLAIVTAMITCGLLIVVSKQYLFADALRPYRWLNDNHINFHHVKGVSLHSNGSFPSGHTISAFCSLAMVGFISSNGFTQFLLFLLAAAAAYSRVYLAQHYLTDIYVGALLGFTIAFIAFIIFERKFCTPYWQKPLLKI